jgi:hypothetical protein
LPNLQLSVILHRTNHQVTRLAATPLERAAPTEILLGRDNQTTEFGSYLHLASVTPLGQAALTENLPSRDNQTTIFLSYLQLNTENCQPSGVDRAD